MTKQISNVENASNEAYKLINNFISENGNIQLLDYLYPEHDGEYIPERCAELLMLRQACYSLRNACDLVMERLNRVIPENEQ